MSLHPGRLLLLGILLGGAVSAAAETTHPEQATEARAKTPFLGGFLKETRVVYPLRHDGWQAQGEHLYDAQEWGASVRYVDAKHPDRWLDIYFYPAGVLTPEELEQSMRNEREELLAAAQPGASYRDMELGPTQRFDYRSWRADGKKGEKSTAYSVDLQMVLNGQLLHSAMTLQLDRLYFIKGRMSAPEGDVSRTALRRQLEKFVAGLTGELSITSTGACWMPMPIEPLPASNPPDALLTLSGEGVQKAVVTREKVFAADPASVEAQAAVALGMSMTGRLIAGCEPVEQINRPVEDGMRELRLEYRATDPEPDGQMPRLRPARVDRG